MKIKTILSVTAIIIFIALAISCNILFSRYRTEKAEKARWLKNYYEQVAYNKRNTEIVYRQKEFISQLSDSLKLLLDSLEIRPKTVLKIVEKTSIIHDTIEKPVNVSHLSEMEWKITDKEKCWIWSGIAKIEDDSLIVKRVGFDYHNKQVDVFSRPLKFKLWFIRIYSKSEIIQSSVSECGSSVSRTITVMKK